MADGLLTPLGPTESDHDRDRTACVPVVLLLVDAIPRGLRAPDRRIVVDRRAIAARGRTRTSQTGPATTADEVSLRRAALPGLKRAPVPCTRS